MSAEWLRCPHPGRAAARHTRESLLPATPARAGVVGVQQGVPGQAQEVMHVGEGHLGLQVVRVKGVTQQTVVDLMQELADVDVGPTARLGRGGR